MRLGETRSDAFQDVSHLLQHLPHRKRVPAGSSRCRHKPIPAYPETGREPARAVLRCLLGGRRRVGRAQAARHQHARPSRAAIGRPSLVPQTARPSLVPQTSEECGADQPGRISTAVQTSWLGEGSTPGWRSARQATSFGRSDVGPRVAPIAGNPHQQSGLMSGRGFGIPRSRAAIRPFSFPLLSLRRPRGAPALARSRAESLVASWSAARRDVQPRIPSPTPHRRSSVDVNPISSARTRDDC